MKVKNVNPADYLTPVKQIEHKSQRTDEEVIQAIKNTGGVLRLMLIALNLSSYQSLYLRIKRSTILTEAMNAVKEDLLDMAENVVLESIKAGNVESSKWYLSKKGRDRGFGESINVTGKVKHEHSNYRLSELSDEEVDKLEEIANRITIDSTASDGD